MPEFEVVPSRPLRLESRWQSTDDPRGAVPAPIIARWLHPQDRAGIVVSCAFVNRSTMVVPMFVVPMSILPTYSFLDKSLLYA